MEVIIKDDNFTIKFYAEECIYKPHVHSLRNDWQSFNAYPQNLSLTSFDIITSLSACFRGITNITKNVVVINGIDENKNEKYIV